MLVDDSAVIRGLIARHLEAEPDIQIKATAANGKIAVDNLKRHQDVDIIVLDIEMPVMTGLEAIPLLLEAKPNVKILMCSTLSQKGADISIQAMSLGAADCILKPTSTRDIGGAEDFKTELLRKIRGLVRLQPQTNKTPPSNTPRARSTTSTSPSSKFPLDDSYTLTDSSKLYKGKPALVAIGSSTGGPQALFKVLEHCRDLPVPVVITQHMPPTFTAILARHIEQNTGLPCREAEEGMEILPGQAYIAPGGKHMVLKKNGNTLTSSLDDGPPENYCKPSVEPMLRSAHAIYGNKVLTVILTGMGHDGRDASRELANEGGRVIAQDKDTSVVWGMPGAVATANICEAVLPLQDIGPAIARAF